MRLNNPVKIVKAFNDCINNRDIDGLTPLMTEDHTFIDRDGSSHGPKYHMVEGWKQFFRMFPHYRNTFDQIKAEGDRVVVLGHAYWSEEELYDPVIWTAKFVNDLIADWRIYVDTPENRQKFNF